MEDALEKSIGGNITDVTVTGGSSGDSAARKLVFVGQTKLRGAGERYLQEDSSSNITVTNIDFSTTPDDDSTLSRSAQAAQQINALAEGGLSDLLVALDLPANSNITLSNLLYTEGEDAFPEK